MLQLISGRISGRQYIPRKMSKRRRLTFSNLSELHSAANSILKTAIINERYKRWNKVVETYRLLLSIIEREFLPDDYEPPNSYGLLMYEIYYHLGVAHQHKHEHRKAIGAFTKAIHAISIPKNGCTAGCSMNTCLLTPLHARRAFASATTGDLSGAMRDAERAVVLDSRNPDVLCVRALTRSSRDEGPLAIRDADEALRIEPNHLGALIIRGALSRPLYAAWSDLYQPSDNEFHRKAASLNSDTKPFLNVLSFKDPIVLQFYNRFLPNLSVPHTVTSVNLTPDKPSKKQLEKNQSLYRSSSARRRVQSAEERERLGEAFKCGTPLPAEINKTTALRRHDYGEAVRKHGARPQTAQEYLTQLLQSLQKRGSMLSLEPRSTSQSESTIQERIQSSNYNPDSSRAGNSRQRTFTRSARSRKLKIESPSNYTIPVFQPVNIKDAPRMYYRPWKGDRLPTAEIKPRKPTLAFY